MSMRGVVWVVLSLALGSPCADWAHPAEPASVSTAAATRQVVTVIETPLGAFEIRQITGFNASRIRTFVEAGQEVKRGERLGRILLGSTVTLAVSKKVRFTVLKYDRVFAGETIIGRY